MGNQKYRKDIEDPEIKRQRYLKQQQQKYLAWLAGIAALLSLLVCGATTIVLVRDIIAPEPTDTVHSSPAHPIERDDLPWPVLVSIIAITGVFALRAGIWANERVVDLEDVPYVPPVAEQIAALPADEVLLRGSDQPTSFREELLRAAHAGARESAEELVRAAQAGTADTAEELLRVSGKPSEGRS